MKMGEGRGGRKGSFLLYLPRHKFRRTRVTERLGLAFSVNRSAVPAVRSASSYLVLPDRPFNRQDAPRFEAEDQPAGWHGRRRLLLGGAAVAGGSRARDGGGRGQSKRVQNFFLEGSSFIVRSHTTSQERDPDASSVEIRASDVRDVLEEDEDLRRFVTKRHIVAVCEESAQKRTHRKT